MPILSVADLPRFKSAFISHGKRAWCYYVPFLLSFSLPPGRQLSWDLYEGGLCLFVRRIRGKGERVDLVIPPLPCSSAALKAFRDAFQSQNPDRSLSILWTDASDAAVLRDSGFELTFKDEGYLYDPSGVSGLEGPSFRDLRKRVRRFEREHAHVFREMGPSDLEACENLLRIWRKEQRRRRSFLLDWGYTKAGLRLVGRLCRNDLSGWVVEVGGEVKAFALTGEMNDDLANFFVAKSDVRVRGLSEFLRWGVCREMKRFSRVNDAGDLGLPGLRQHKRKFRPVGSEQVYSAQSGGMNATDH